MYQSGTELTSCSETANNFQQGDEWLPLTSHPASQPLLWLVPYSERLQGALGGLT